MKILTERHHSADPGIFTETVEYKVLNCTNLFGNNCKFYCIELQQDPNSGAYQIFTHYGRIGKNSTYDVRKCKMLDNDAIIGIDEMEARKEYNRLIKRKLKGKKMDGYQENYEEVEVVNPTVGSDNLRNLDGKSTVITSVWDIKAEVKGMDTRITTLIDQICEENIHNLTSVMDIEVTDNGIETPLGKLTPNQIERAKVPLNELNTILMQPIKVVDQIRKLSTYFYSLVPHKFNGRITDTDLLNTSDIINDKFELLDMLESAVQMGDSINKSAGERYKALGTDIKILKDKLTIDRIERYIEQSKASNHRHSDIYNLKVVSIYEIEIPTERKRFNATHGNIMELFHGSRNCNILSILKNGLIIVKSGITKTGEMFGPGIYFADSSTKSANYSHGFWGGIKNKYPNNFMFLADVALGNVKEEHSSTYYTNAPSGYQSVKGCKGSYLYNNEYIVYDPAKVTLKYLVEFKV